MKNNKNFKKVYLSAKQYDILLDIAKCYDIKVSSLIQFAVDRVFPFFSPVSVLQDFTIKCFDDVTVKSID